MAGKLAGKAAIVTGAGRSIGEAIAEKLAQEGAKLVLVALEADELGVVAKRLRDGGAEVAELAGDLTDDAFVRRIYDTCLETYGRLDLVVNNAGVLFNLDTLQTSTEDLMRHWDITARLNSRGTYLSSVVACKEMAQRGGGMVINISSTQGKSAPPRMTAYASSKYGIIGMTQSLGREVGATGVRLYAVCPPGVRTRMAWEGLGRDVYERMQADFLEAEDVAEVVRKLAVGEMTLENGESIVVMKQ